MNIQVGDLVVCIRSQPCCSRTFGMWRTFKVGEVWTGQSRCTACGHVTDSPVACPVGETLGGFLVSRLIKIDPPAIDENTEANRQLADSTPA